jgi:hypothetical protein
MEKENGIGVIFKDFPKLAEIYGNEFDILWMAKSATPRLKSGVSLGDF